MLLRLVTHKLKHVRKFHTTISSFAAESTHKMSKEQLKRRELRKMIQRTLAAKRPANEHPLYMPLQQALRFLRSAEVGQPQSQQTISLTTMIVNEKGSALLNGNISFPKPLKEVKIAVFTNDNSQIKLTRDKCHLVGGSELIEKIKNGEVPIDFEKAFATPDLVQQLSAQLGRILGPRGLLPNIKKGTVSDNVVDLIEHNLTSIPFRQRGNCISMAVGKCTFTDREILENIISVQKAFKEAILNQKAKKPSLLGQTTLTTTHGPGIVIDFN